MALSNDVNASGNMKASGNTNASSNMTYMDSQEGVEITDEKNEIREVSIDEMRRFIQLNNELKKLEKDLSDFQKKNEEELIDLEAKILKSMADNAMPNFTIDGFMVYITSRNLIAMNQDSVKDNDTKKESIIHAFKNTIDSFDSDIEREQYISHLMDLQLKELIIESMKRDENLSVFITENYNSNTMTATLHDLKKMYGDIPDSVKPFFNLGSKESLRVKESKKSKNMKN